MTDDAADAGADLAGELERLGYTELFLRTDDTALDRVWHRPGAPVALRRLALGPPSLGGFLAAEVLFARDENFPPPDDGGALARVYAEALRRDLTGLANPWGLPGELDAPLARHVRALGDAAVPAFAALLDDDTELAYGGSKEATVGAGYGYRVKDVAASLLASLLGVPSSDLVDPGQRDVEIDRLRRRLP